MDVSTYFNRRVDLNKHGLLGEYIFDSSNEADNLIFF